jgi:LmbE family N-acetylglucosaminyl deacetylase
MLELTLPHRQRGRPLRVLCLGAHCDDIDIGCGGTLLKLLGRGRCEVTWVVFSSTPERAREVRASARRLLRRASRSRVETHGFRDGYFPAEYAAVKDAVESLKALPAPDIVFTHHRADLHQDHRLVGELTWSTFRRHLILEYEIPKYDGGLTTPNTFVALERAQVNAKVRTLLGCYPSQRSRPWFSEATFLALLRLRGVEAGARSGWAEGFHASKLCIA